MAYRNPVSSRLRSQYGLHLQIGFVLSLALVLIATQVPVSPDEETTGPEVQKQETVDLRHVQQTQQERTAPAPPKPPVPQAVPNDKVIEPSERDFDASLGVSTSSSQATGTRDESPPSLESPSANEVFVDVQQRPDCGGVQTLQRKTRYPPPARKLGLEGRVFVQFIVGEEGSVTNPQIVRGTHEVLNRAALRAVKRLDCTPGKQRSRPVKVKMTMPVAFMLDSEA